MSFVKATVMGLLFALYVTGTTGAALKHALSPYSECVGQREDDTIWFTVEMDDLSVIENVKRACETWTSKTPTKYKCSRVEPNTEPKQPYIEFSFQSGLGDMRFNSTKCVRGPHGKNILKVILNDELNRSNSICPDSRSSNAWFTMTQQFGLVLGLNYSKDPSSVMSRENPGLCTTGTPPAPSHEDIENVERKVL